MVPPLALAWLVPPWLDQPSSALAWLELASLAMAWLELASLALAWLEVAWAAAWALAWDSWSAPEGCKPVASDYLVSLQNVN